MNFTYLILGLLICFLGAMAVSALNIDRQTKIVICFFIGITIGYVVTSGEDR